MNVLIVEDERKLADILVQIMLDQKYLADAVHDGTAGLEYALSGQYDIVILDVMLPGRSGFEVVRAMRDAGRDTPVLLLTARSDVPDRVTGLDSGADDYLTKPFSTEELLARIRALSRRKGEVTLEILSWGGLELDLNRHDLSCAGRTVHLSFKEFEVMRLFLANPDVVLTKETLITRVWGYDSDAAANNVEAYISFLRKKLFYLKAPVALVFPAQGRVPNGGARLMMQKLRRRFIAINMLLVGVVLLAVLSLFLYSSIRNLHNDADARA